MKSISLSLEQLLGSEFMAAVREASVSLYSMDRKEAERLSCESVDFFPNGLAERIEKLLDKVGQQVIPEMKATIQGAPTESFRRASNLKSSPVGGIGYLRLGEDGRLYLTAKSEHYHAPLGHGFPGYRLIDNAKALGITNTTHNNTRGHITRLLETELVRTANGLGPDDTEGLNNILSSKEPHVLNRVINLETGSLGVEAGVKMMLARFYKLEDTYAAPKYHDRIPVFLVMGDNEGGCKANYHGTTVLTQIMRGMWPDMYNRFRTANIFEVCPVAINNFEDFKVKFERYNKPPYKTAGFLHEIILMNYGGIRLEKEFLKKAYQLCRQEDTPVLCDEIQSCMWFPGLYLFRQYDLKPDFVVIGKGFPGGLYAASRIITTYEMDNLSQFGALVTNGQEELASLAYLVTMAFAQANEAYIGEIGLYYEDKLTEMANKYSNIIACIQGKGHLSTIFFRDVDHTIEFVKKLNSRCIDISAHTYKANCPPAALTKIPIISSRKMVDYLVAKMEEVLKGF